MQVTEAIILAGGKGTRLRSVISDVPKPMAKIQDVPFLEILIENFHAKGIRHFILSVGYMADTILEYFKDKYPSLDISFSLENKPLGTGGATRRAFEHVRGQFALVLNGDSLFDVQIEELNHFGSDDLPIIFGRHVNDVSRYGHFMYEGKEIHNYKEKEGCGPGYINGGVYVLGKDTLRSFPADQYFSIESDYFSKFSKKNSATLISSDDYFIDIGLPESYRKAQEELKPYMQNKALFLDRDGVINLDTGYLHKSEECIFIDGSKELLRAAKDRGYLNIVVTNQAGIGRGYYSENEFQTFMNWMNSSLDNLIDDYFFCPFHPEHGVGAYKHDSWDRKPNPGMFEKAIKKHNISPLRSIMIGDNLSDIEAAKKVLVARNLLFVPKPKTSLKIDTISKLYEAEQFL